MASFKTPSSLLTILDVVNMCLATIGVDSVDSYETSEDADVGLILNELNAADLEVQANGGNGWAFNSDESYLLQLAVDGTVPLPDQTLSVRSAYLIQNTAAGISVNGSTVPTLVTERAGKLYDQINHTDVFTVPVIVDLVTRQDFECIPQVFRNYIARMAGHRFQGKVQGSQVVIQITSQDVYRALTACEQWDDQARPQSSTNANRYVNNKLYAGGVRRNRQQQ